MTYLANEAAHESPVEMYEFTRDSVVYRYASGDETVTDADGESYAPAVLARRAIEASAEDTSQSVEIDVPSGNPVAAWFQTLVQPFPVWVRIRRRHRGHTGSANEALVFYGRVETALVDESGKATLHAVPITKAVRRVLPTITVQPECAWQLYDSATCGVLETDHKYDAVITANAAGVLTVSGSSFTSPVPDVGEFAAGFIEWYPNGDTSATLRRQWVTAHPALRTLHLFTHEATIPLNVSARVWVYSGCDRTIGTCKARFDNVVNYGGAPDMPASDPFQTRFTE